MAEEENSDPNANMKATSASTETHSKKDCAYATVPLAMPAQIKYYPTSHSERLLVSESKFTPILKSCLLSALKGSA